jgi:hypothetical protein
LTPIIRIKNTDRETERQIKKRRDKEVDINLRIKNTDRQTERQTEEWREREVDTNYKNKKHRQTEGETDGGMERQRS